MFRLPWVKPTYLNAVYELLDDKVAGGPVDGPISEITLHDGQIAPSEEAIQTKLASMIVEWDAQEYARNRKIAYPPMGDQWDMVYKDMKNSTTTHADAVEVVKTKWPKDNSGPVE